MSDHQLRERPELWSDDEDTYTDLGRETLDDIKRAIRTITDPLIDAHVDAAHLTAIASEAMQSACQESWNIRQDHP